MALANMIKTDESALICDLAETYHIYDYRSLPLHLVATFSVGLRENSRIKKIMAGMKYDFETLLLAAIVDGINLSNWSMSENARNGGKKPESIVNRLLGIEPTNNRNEMIFDSAEEYEEMRKKLLGRS